MDGRTSHHRFAGGDAATSVDANLLRVAREAQAPRHRMTRSRPSFPGRRDQTRGPPGNSTRADSRGPPRRAAEQARHPQLTTPTSNGERRSSACSGRNGSLRADGIAAVSGPTRAPSGTRRDRRRTIEDTVVLEYLGPHRLRARGESGPHRALCGPGDHGKSPAVDWSARTREPSGGAAQTTLQGNEATTATSYFVGIGPRTGQDHAQGSPCNGPDDVGRH